MRITLLAAVALAVTAACFQPQAPALAAAGEVRYSPRRVQGPNAQAHGRWAERTAATGDLDGDRVNDVYVGVPAENVDGQKNVGRVYALSGKPLARGRAVVLHEIASPEPQVDAAFGFAVSVLGDVDGDRTADVAIGTEGHDVPPHPNQGRAWVFSGRTGKLLYALDNPAPQGTEGPQRDIPGHLARFGSRIGRAGDVTGDKVPDIIVGASGNDVPAGCSEQEPAPPGCRSGQGQAFIFDGRSGALFRTLDLPSDDYADPSGCRSSCGSFGLSVQGPGDTNGDGVPDQLVSAPAYKGIGRMYLFSGKTGDVLLRIDDPVPQPGAIFGFQDAAPMTPGDVDGDGAADIYGNGFLQNVRPTGAGEGQAWVFSGRTGKVLHNLRAPVPQDGAQFGFSMTSTYHGPDTVPDLYVGSSPHHVPGAGGDGGTYVFNGKNGSLLTALELPAGDIQPSTPLDLGPNLGWTVSAPGDLNGDDKPDYLAGAPFSDVGANQDQGLLYVFLSGPGSGTASASRGPDGSNFPLIPVLAGAGMVLAAAAVVALRMRGSRGAADPDGVADS